MVFLRKYNDYSTRTHPKASPRRPESACREGTVCVLLLLRLNRTNPSAVPGGSLGAQRCGAQTPLPPKIPRGQAHKALRAHAPVNGPRPGIARRRADARTTIVGANAGHATKRDARDPRPARRAPAGGEICGRQNQAF